MSATLPFKTQIPVDDAWDVIVVGGGPAGCAAAAAAAREGAKTLLVEATGCLGGMGTSGLVPAWCPFSDKEKIIYRGLAEKVFSRSKAGTFDVAPEALDWVPIDPENLKRVYDDLMAEYGVTVLFHTMIVGLEKSAPDRVEYLLAANKAGLTALRAPMYVDGSGDGDLAAWAGAEFHKGDEEGGMQPATHCFVLGNVDTEEYRKLRLHPGNPNSPIHEIVRSGKYPLIPDTHLCNNLVGPDAVGFNAGHIWNIDNTDPHSVSRALPQGRKMASTFLSMLSDNCPGAFSRAYLAQTAPLLGIRETRRVVGDYTLVAEDYLAARGFADEIGRSSYYIDVHHKEKEKKNPEQTLSHKFPRLGPGQSFGIPYRCLTPKGLRNVIMAGRSISSDRAVNGSVRVMPVCLVTGEAAGMAAAMAGKTAAADVHQVDTARLRERLRAEGVYLP